METDKGAIYIYKKNHQVFFQFFKTLESVPPKDSPLTWAWHVSDSLHNPRQRPMWATPIWAGSQSLLEVFLPFFRLEGLEKQTVPTVIVFHLPPPMTHTHTHTQSLLHVHTHTHTHTHTRQEGCCIGPVWSFCFLRVCKSKVFFLFSCEAMLFSPSHFCVLINSVVPHVWEA